MTTKGVTEEELIDEIVVNVKAEIEQKKEEPLPIEVQLYRQRKKDRKY